MNFHEFSARTVGEAGYALMQRGPVEKSSSFEPFRVQEQTLASLLCTAVKVCSVQRGDRGPQIYCWGGGAAESKLTVPRVARLGLLITQQFELFFVTTPPDVIKQRRMSLKALIEQKITEALTPSHLEVINESRNHGAGEEAESHFKVIVVSDKFDGGSVVILHCTCIAT